MKSFVRTIVAFVFGSIWQVTAAQALNDRSWVSHTGNDANACTSGAPCLTIQRSVDQTNSGGHLNILDPGEYGGLSINIAKSISINNDSAGAVVLGPNGVIINAQPSDVII